VVSKTFGVGIELWLTMMRRGRRGLEKTTLGRNVVRM